MHCVAAACRSYLLPCIASLMCICHCIAKYSVLTGLIIKSTWQREGQRSTTARMGYFRDILLVLEPVLIPELATYETEIFAAVVLISLLMVVGMCSSAVCVYVYPSNLLVVLSWCCLRGKKKDHHVCLLGLSDSGKTLLFMRVCICRIGVWSGSHDYNFVHSCMVRQLKYRRYFDTLSSIKENVTEYLLPDKVSWLCRITSL